ncbi:MAG: hypothetical protein K1564_07575 [Candidatus Thiodiazotropha sp. (ex. Lucinisca nassula)]|nr:hypothetical protein [Candidatus Thiodiazotropha sp. (ex. Lucinisca nassula)]
MKWIFFRLLGFLSDKHFAQIVFLLKLRYWPNLVTPSSINEKVNYLKLYSNNPKRLIAADRLKVREYVKKKSNKLKLIDLLWSGTDLTEEDYNTFPVKFVIKANHGSGMVMVVNKNNSSYKVVLQQVKKWLYFDYGSYTRERIYQKIPRVLVVERFLSELESVPPDYKFICLNGQVSLIQVDIDRFSKHKRNIYLRDLTRIYGKTSYPAGPEIKIPNKINDAIEIAEIIACDYDFIRVDLFILESGIYFGELTNFPHNGLEPYIKDFDYEIGSKLEIEEKIHQNAIH